MTFSTRGCSKDSLYLNLIATGVMIKNASFSFSLAFNTYSILFLFSVSNYY